MANLLNLKTSVQFPEIGRIRKGAPKEKRVKDGREYSTVGKDLQDKFRVVFAPGQQPSVDKFIARYGSLTPKDIVIMLPFNSIDAVWDASYTCYSAGRLVARADGEKFIYKVNPRNGELEVKDGEPFTPFHHGEAITYDGANGRRVVLPVRPTGLLRVFLPDLERMVQLALVTTSIYDILNISRQLNAIQMLAGGLNNGAIAGIPIVITRQPQEITWVKEGGEATRITKWLINLEAHPEWVAAAVARLRRQALPGQQETALLLPPAAPAAPPITTTVDPEHEDHGEAEDDFEEGSYSVSDGPQEPEYSSADPAAATPEPQVPAGKPTNGQGPFGMTYATASTCKNADGIAYTELSTQALVVRLNNMLKDPSRNSDPDIKFKMDAVRTILHFRNLENTNAH